MFNGIRAYVNKKLGKKPKIIFTQASNSFGITPQSPQTASTGFYQNTTNNNSLQFAQEGEVIFSISEDGEAKWHKEDSYNKAAEIFLTYLTMRVENQTNIKQNRREWEDRILEAMKKHAKIEPLTPEVLTDVFKKTLMIDKLKGIK